MNKIKEPSLIRRSYVPTLRQGGYAIEEHSTLEAPRVVAAGLGKHQAEAVARIITNAVDQFCVDNRLKKSVRNNNPHATLPAKDRCI